MSDVDHEHGTRDISKTVARKALRKLRAKQAGPRGVLFGLGMFGLIGWSIAVPTLTGIAAGLWLDRHFPNKVSWTITLLFAGIVLGCFNAWRWIKKERPTQ